MAECDAVGAGGRTAAAVAAAAGRGDGDDGGAVAAAAERDGDAVADGGAADDDAAVADGGHGVDGGQEAADRSCSAKKCPSWVRRCLRAPTYLLGSEVEKDIQARSSRTRVDIQSTSTTFDDMILSAERLGHFGIQEGDKRKRPEWLGNKHVRHFSKFAEIVAQVVRRDVLRAPADEYFARDLRGATLF